MSMAQIAAEPSAAVPEVMDRQAALARLEGDRELLGEMASLFLEDCDPALRRIRRAIKRLDSRSAALEAHALKGSLASLAATEARRTAAELEALAVCEDHSKAAEACDRLVSALQRLRPMLQDLAHSAAP